MNTVAGVSEYLASLKKSPKFGPQVVCHRLLSGSSKQCADGSVPVAPVLLEYLKRKGIDKLYTHQEQAIDKIAQGHDILVATPTASGKSLIYNLPVVSAIASQHPGNGLYLFPLKALAQDQLRVLQSLLLALPEIHDKNIDTYAAIFDGDTSPYWRRKIRESGTRVLLTNPEMLHLSLLPYHGNWLNYFKDLKYIIVDEVHTYRGILGAHMAWIFRRLQRIAASYGSNPQFIMLSATIGNPEELGEQLLGRPVQVISHSGAAKAPQHMVFLNPWDSPAYTASQLLEAAVKRGLRTIVYTQSRKMTELINLWTRPRLGEDSDKLSSYRAGFLPEERREIEGRLVRGELLGVISTSALELGIDIGDLDLCILVGYPGSIMATYQRGGRVGRSMQESAIILIAQEDALDQYFMRRPDDFFRRQVESAVLNPYNDSIMSQHLHCCAAESALRSNEPLLKDSRIQGCLDTMTRNGQVLQSADGTSWFASRTYPQRHISLRGGGKQLAIINKESGEILGEIDSVRALKECHPGAVYIHRATTWVVERLDLEGHEVVVCNDTPTYFTRPMSNKNTSILETMKVSRCYGCRVSFGRLRVKEQVTGYQKRNSGTQKLIATVPLDLPEQVIETEGFWLDIPSGIKHHLETERYHFMGGIHALEHAMIAVLPLLVLCDRNDVGGISCPHHEQTDEASIFVYDGHAGGVGLVREAYDRMKELLDQTEQMIRSCDCESGCPSCVHSPKCGSGNRPIDKLACLYLLEQLLAIPSEEEIDFKNLLLHSETQQNDTTPSHLPKEDKVERAVHRCGVGVLPAHYGVFDLETIRSAEEVGGWHHADRMGMSVGVVFDSQLGDFVTYLEHETDKLADHLHQLDLVVGFNNKRFDNRVLAGYGLISLAKLPTLDLLEQASGQLGYRLSLNRLAEHTLGVKKTADGLQALAWYKQGRIDLIRRYCRHDVAITRDLLLFGLEKGYWLFQNKAGQVVRLPLNLEQPILGALR